MTMEVVHQLLPVVSSSPSPASAQHSSVSVWSINKGGRKRALLVLGLGVLLLRLAYMALEAPLLRGLSSSTVKSTTSTTSRSTGHQCQSLQGSHSHKVIQRALQAQLATTSSNSHASIHLIPERPKGRLPIQCNPFHLLWGYASPFREVLELGIIKAIDEIQQQESSLIPIHVSLTVNITIAVYECQGWLEYMLNAFPIPTFDNNINMTIHTQHITTDLEEYLLRHENTSITEHCFLVPFQWSSFVGRHDTWKPQLPGSHAALHMHQWTQAMRDKYLSSPQQSNDDTVCHRERPLALFVERGCVVKPRTAIDLQTGNNAFQHIQAEVQELGYDTQIVEICNNITHQLQVFSNANVVISSHGAQLTNMIFMQPCTFSSTNDISSSPIPITFQPAIVEISFRFGWCEPKTPFTESNGTRSALLERWHHCPMGNRYYNKADFFRLATGMGIRYTEIVPHSLVNMLATPDPIDVEQIVVDSQLIVEALSHLLQDHTYDYQKQTTYNGWEGVEPYTYADSWRYYWYRIWKMILRRKKNL